jgi:hypothetical protein
MACLPIFFVNEAFNYLFNLRLTQFDIIVWTILSSVIGIGLATAIRYAIHAARNHKA